MSVGTNLMQLTLLRPPQLDPLPTDNTHYVAAVQNKAGELSALKNASAETWKRMTPLVHVVGPLTKREIPYPASTISAWLKRIADAIGTHPAYLDVLRLNPMFPVDRPNGSQPVLSQIYIAARRRGVQFVPVVWAGESSAKHIELVADAAAEDGHGIAVRYKFLRAVVPSGSTRAKVLSETLARLDTDVVEADLLIDLEYLDPDEDLDAESVAASIEEMLAVGAWRSVVVLGTTIPKMLGCIDEGTVGSLERREWKLWNQLGNCALTRLPAFGDYAVQHPHPPTGGGPGMRANIRYTVAAATLIARGEGSVIQEGNEQYRDLCEQLVKRSEFCGPKYTWGDFVIDGCAKGAIPPGSQNLWRGAGTSHHLRFVTDAIRQMAQAN